VISEAKPNTTDSSTLNVSVVIPVYSGEDTLPALVHEFEQYTSPTKTALGHSFVVNEVFLVWDRGPRGTDQTMRDLARAFAWVKPIWLSRNFGQHAATLAGMTSSGGDWIVTMDEDGQHDPAFIADMIDTAYTNQAQVVYASPRTRAPHSKVRNLSSKFAKRLFAGVLSGDGFAEFNSYRLILGEVGRSVAAYTGAGVYLDVALSWVVADVTTCPVIARKEGRPATNYNYRKLAQHFGRLIVSSGTRPLLLVFWLGLFFMVGGGLGSLFIVYQRVTGALLASGWASTLVVLMLIGGSILLSLGVIAQYVGAATNMSLGKPLYVVVGDPKRTFDSKAHEDS